MFENAPRRVGRIRPHQPSPSMIVALTALFVALGGTGYAALNPPANSVGTTQLKDGAVTTPKLANGAVTSAKLGAAAVTGAKLGSAAVTGAKLASNAVTTDKVKDYSLLAKDFRPGQLPGSGLVTTNGTIKLSTGQSRTIWSHGPLTITGSCTDLGSGNYHMKLSGTSTQANSALNGELGTSNPTLLGASGTGFTETTNNNLNLAAPSGAALDVVADVGVHGLGAACFVHGFGLGQG